MVTTKSAIDATGSRVATGSGSTYGYLLADLHGNTAGALDSSCSAITDAFAYDAYGNTVASVTSSLPTPWRFQGRILESATGTPDLYDFGARSYAPGLGAFTSLDSLHGSAQNPALLNGYLYANANPATLVDPDGHLAKCRYGDDCPRVQLTNSSPATGGTVCPDKTHWCGSTSTKPTDATWTSTGTTPPPNQKTAAAKVESASRDSGATVAGVRLALQPYYDKVIANFESWHAYLTSSADAQLKYIEEHGLEALRLLREDPHDAATNPAIFNVASAYFYNWLNAKYGGQKLPHQFVLPGAGLSAQSFFDVYDDLEPAKLSAMKAGDDKVALQIAAEQYAPGSDRVAAKDLDPYGQLKENIGKAADAMDKYRPAKPLNWDQWWVDQAISDGTDNPATPVCAPPNCAIV